MSDEKTRKPPSATKKKAQAKMFDLELARQKKLAEAEQVRLDEAAELAREQDELRAAGAEERGRELTTHRGRDVSFSHELADKICDKIAEGKTLRAACRELDLCEKTVRIWVFSDRGANVLADPPVPGMATLMRRAMMIQADAWADYLIELADNVRSKDDVPVAKFKFEVRKFFMSKANPKYRDNFELTIEDVREKPPLRVIGEEISGEEAAAMYADRLREQRARLSDAG